MDGSRSFIEADKHSAVDVGGLRRGTISVQVKKPHSARLSLRRSSEKAPTSQRCELRIWAFINAKHVELERWRPPLVDADWHAFCQTF